MARAYIINDATGEQIAMLESDDEASFDAWYAANPGMVFLRQDGELWMMVFDPVVYAGDMRRAGCL